VKPDSVFLPEPYGKVVVMKGFSMKFFIACIVALCVGGAAAPVAFAAPSTDLDGLIAYPNPYKPSASTAKVITFAPVTVGHLRLKIYKLSGELVYEDELDGGAGSIHWDVKDRDNNPVASGLYTYFISDQSGRKVKGKIAVIK
jgi:hypothetical protein